VSAPFGSRVVIPRRHSLRWRLPLLFCAIIVIVLAAFLVASYREVEATLVGAGGMRAQNAASQVANLLASAAEQGLNELRRVADDPRVKLFLGNPTEEAREGVRASLAPLTRVGPKRIELWSGSGDRLLEVVVPAGDGAAQEDLPPGHPPSGPGFQPLQVSTDVVLAEVVAEIREESLRADVDSSARLGYLALRSTLSISPPGILSRLVGDDALVVMGNRRGGLWTDLSSAVPAPPVDLTREGAAEYLAPDGQSRLGALVGVRATPWAVWVELRKAAVVAPARTFLRSMIVAGGVFVGIGALLVTGFTARFTTPLHDLAQAAGTIAAGDYSKRVPANRRDEVGRLSSAFNTMAVKVEQAYRDLKEVHDHTQFALAAAQIGVWESDPRSGRIKLSESMRFVLGAPASVFDGRKQNFLAFVHPDERGSMAKIVDGETASPDVFDLEFRALWPDGSVHWIEGKGRVVRGENGTPTSVLAVSIDVTERRHLQALLTQAQKMEAIGHLAGGVAHDFNNVLTAILGYGNLVLEEVSDPRLRDEVLEILRAGESAAALTRQLLAFSRRQVMQPAVVSLNRVVAGVEKMLRRLISEDIDLVTTLHPGLDSVRVDSAQFEQVIVNLALNARDAMPDGGRLTVETNMIDLDEEYCREHPSVKPGRHVVLSVTDTGTGMDAETQARLFEPFFTTKGQGRGTGLGLAMVYGIVKQSEGHIYVYSEPGRGTTFKIYLPSVEEPAAATVKPAPPELAGGVETILIVEDDDAARKLASRVLKRLGYGVLTAGGGEEALRLLEARTETVNLLISDVIMPGMTGPELAQRVSTTHPEMRVLFTSGYSDDAIIRHGVLAPGTLFMQKPYTPAVLARKVREALVGA
jgi:PAS domain S-box-containing protein